MKETALGLTIQLFPFLINRKFTERKRKIILFFVKYQIISRKATLNLF